MVEPLIEALGTLLTPIHLLALLGGVLMGMVFGAVPGLGGIVGLAILLPFTFGMPPSIALLLMIGLLSVISTTDTIPAVLFGVPGTTAAQATILDGHPMAKKGEADRALGAAFLASIIGGIFGTIILLLSIPILRPLVLAFGSPEFFMMGLLGVTMVGTLSSGSVVRGLMAAALGIGLAMVGPAPQVATPRWHMGQVYLLDGIPVVPLVLGIFAVPEMVELFIKGTRLAEPSTMAGLSLARRVRRAGGDVLANWFLVLRSGAIGTIIGAIPGLGSAVVDWFAYGHAAATERNARDTFGKGDIRGVLAPESANNSKNGGELIPTLAFGIPGSAPMALLLGAMLFLGMRPGPDMLTVQLDLTLMMIWGIVLANVIGGTLCLLLASHIAKITVMPAHYIVPTIFVIVTFAAFQTTRSVGDLVALVAFAILGWCMKATGFPRPPLVLAFVLAPILENYLFISMRRFGMDWVTRPIVLVLALMIILTIAYGLYTTRRQAAAERAKVSVQ